MFYGLIVSYLVVVALVDWWAWGYFHKRWSRRERARITVGVMLVFGPAAPLAMAGIVDLTTCLVLFGGFGVAGMVTVYRDIQHQTTGSDDIRDQILEQ